MIQPRHPAPSQPTLPSIHPSAAAENAPPRARIHTHFNHASPFWVKIEFPWLIPAAGGWEWVERARLRSLLVRLVRRRSSKSRGPSVARRRAAASGKRRYWNEFVVQDKRVVGIGRWERGSARSSSSSSSLARLIFHECFFSQRRVNRERRRGTSPPPLLCLNDAWKIIK
jgi:hypothetical protein